MEATLQILQGDVQALSVRYANHCDELNGPVTDENIYRNTCWEYDWALLMHHNVK